MYVAGWLAGRLCSLYTYIYMNVKKEKKEKKGGLHSAAFAYHTTQCFTFTLLHSTLLYFTPLISSSLLSFSLLSFFSSPHQSARPPFPQPPPPLSFFLTPPKSKIKTTKRKRGNEFLFIFIYIFFHRSHGIGHTKTAAPPSYCWCLASSPLSPSSRRWKKGFGEFSAWAAYWKVDDNLTRRREAEGVKLGKEANEPDVVGMHEKKKKEEKPR